MCGRYHVDLEEENAQVRKILEEINRRYFGTPEREQMKSGEIFPTNIVPVCSNNRKLQPGYFLMKWGFSAFEGTGVIINARSESLLEKPMFRKAALERRCLVPASHYFEWERRGRARVKYAIRLPKEGLIYMAGIYRVEEGERLPSFAIITRPAADEIAFIHDRMPLILADGDRAAWLKPDADVAGLIARAQAQVRFEAVG